MFSNLISTSVIYFQLIQRSSELMKNDIHIPLENNLKMLQETDLPWFPLLQEMLQPNGKEK